VATHTHTQADTQTSIVGYRKYPPSVRAYAFTRVSRHRALYGVSGGEVKWPMMLDGGARRGTDVAKTLASGNNEIRATGISTYKHRGALRGNPRSVCPQPEPNATELPSCAPISAQTAQRQCGGGGGVARRARAARARKAKSFATSCGTSPTTSCAASFTCSSFMCHLRAGVGGGVASGSPRAVQRSGKAGTFFKSRWF